MKPSPTDAGLVIPGEQLDSLENIEGPRLSFKKGQGLKLFF